MIAAQRFTPLGILGPAGCAEMNPASQGAPDLVEAQLERTSADGFAVTLAALTTNGYELARCLVAGFANTLQNENGDRLHDVFRREGGQPTNEIRVHEGVRTQTTMGMQTHAFDPELEVGDHDGRDVMAVDVQLARCDRAGLPTSVE